MVKICHVFICWKSIRNPNSKTYFFSHKKAPYFFFFPPQKANKQNSFLGGGKVRAQLLWELILRLCQGGCSLPLSSPTSAGKVCCQQGRAQRHKSILTSLVPGSWGAGALLGLATLITSDSLGSCPSSLSTADSALIWLRSGQLLKLSLSMTDLAGVDGDILWVWQWELGWC